MKIIFKYGSLIVLILIFLLKTQRYSDFLASNDILKTIGIIAVLIFLNFVIIYIYESKSKTKHRSTNVLVIIFLLLITLNIFFNYLQFKKEIWKEYYVPNNYFLKVKGYEIKLYKDNSYEINEYWHGESQHYFGKYNFVNDTLNINDKNIETKTESQLTSQYKFNKYSKEFEPLENGFKNLKNREK